MEQVVQQSRFRPTFLILFSISLLLDPGCSMPALDPDENWVCDVTQVGRKKPLSGHCYTYQQCQWRDFMDYDMEILTCPDDKIYDKSINECINEKSISFDFEKSRCEKKKPNVSSAKHNSKTPQPGRSVTKEPPPQAKLPKTPTKSAFSSSESTPTVKPIPKNDPNPFDYQPVRPKSSEEKFTQQPNFFTPFNNFPPTEKSSRRILFHEPFVKPY
ncbi:uncharacterized protein LOC118433264 [Folsomia candida]|uniref:Chitin-binding type-2 domain-containing protein n=1 Tax=Folsomia candida TaxID=158441 RepID=A0A226D0X6_FOLCA|nr:uncharacterized protein LOC118433264 [Folsomia candida]OXA38504.1 hypothetical protein Fcan01_26713 [Folsomia candida]